MVYKNNEVHKNSANLTENAILSYILRECCKWLALYNKNKVGIIFAFIGA